MQYSRRPVIDFCFSSKLSKELPLHLNPNSIMAIHTVCSYLSLTSLTSLYPLLCTATSPHTPQSLYHLRPLPLAVSFARKCFSL